KGWMSNPLLKQRDSHLIRSGLKQFSGKEDYRTGGLKPPEMTTIVIKNQEAASTHKDRPPLPPQRPKAVQDQLIRNYPAFQVCCEKNERMNII
ncbi:MAG: hypothetical protein ACRDBM_16570, partial [Sporomusa sp.]